MGIFSAIISRLAYYRIIRPISLVPTGVLYAFSDLLFYFVYYVAPYRYGVVIKNLRASFPEKSEPEIQKICKQFYRQFCELTVEGIRGFGISKNEILKRYKFVNPEVMDQYFERGKRVMQVGGHLGNWEWSPLALPSLSRFKTYGVYQHLTNPFFDRKVAKSRMRFGAFLINLDDATKYRAEIDEMATMGFFMDQSPARTSRKYWLKFLNQYTPTQFKAESLAVRHGDPVVFFEVKRVKRGYYELRWIPITDDPKNTKKGEITETFMRLLEKAIRADPPTWLWTHNRWKIKLTPDELKPYPDLVSAEVKRELEELR